MPKNKVQGSKVGMIESTEKTDIGLLLVSTGDGKGKTTSALGQALRAVGQGLTVCFIQFVKGQWVTGESLFFQQDERIEFHTLGTGFTWLSADKTKVVEKAQEAWEFAKQRMMSGAYDLVVLDELTYLVTYNMLTEEELVAFLRQRPAGLHVVVTGRDASAGLIAEADLVTEMRAIKHPYAKGVVAQKGIEF